MSDRAESNPSNDSVNRPLAKTPSQQQGFLESVVDWGEDVFNSGKAFIKPAIAWIGQKTHETGQVVTAVGNNPILKNPIVQRFAGVLRLDWLLGLTKQVDLEKAKTEVDKLKRKYPHESPSEIAHRLMVRKAIAASGIGFASSILPGLAAALLALDLAANMALQTEMVYEIAAAYGLDLDDAARKGEVVAIFGLALGGSNALKAGLGFMRNIPLAGAAIGAGTNATMLYSLGYAACRFYEAKLEQGKAEPTPQTLEVLQKKSEEYLDVAIAQQAIMDRILVHMILASYPQKTWDDILPDLKALNLEPSSLEVIASNIQSPEPLDDLLNRLDRDFAIPLFAQCQRIASRQDGIVSQPEATILQAIADKLDLENNFK
ncbi:MAG: hypothetical protein MUD14_27785 [Hydrococcus sp. Prado102]|jgi:uncharacterized protein (DUF697 family)|nr:hypothetical protein [Hydrococcus sp. Prado102]